MKTYSPSEVCDLFQVAKTTLYRWETDGKISPVPRKRGGEREYKQSHIAEIAKLQLKDLSKEHRLASRSENETWMKKILQTKSIIKTLYLEDLSGVYELAESRETLSKETVRELLLKAADLEPEDALFEGIIELVHMKTPRPTP